MDPALVGWIGGIAGGAIGLLGAGIGIYASLAASKSSAETRLIWTGAAILCVLIGGHLATLALVPVPWSFLSWVFYPILLTATILWFNRRQAKLRQHGSGNGSIPG
ncbi:MAG TPA: hypothetical protein VGN57_07805 [Pirellulaceae bacterium]|jgi:hypothetical protein|nr:hypothetical protein [Pirellulaceae bacterium]